MKQDTYDVLIVGAGPVGMMCAYLSEICGLRAMIVDKSSGPLRVGRADALNARTLQLLELVDLFDDLYPLGKRCNTSSVWKDGGFISRESSWWENLQGCLHKHFLMIGQCHLETLLDRKLKDLHASVERQTEVQNIEIGENKCLATLSNGAKIESNYVIGADGSQSFVRNHLKVPFSIVRPQIVWAVIDGIIQSDFPKVPEIIVFQAQTSDVAWIPREGEIDRFYVRMDTTDFTFDQALKKINNAIIPYSLNFEKVEWYSQFSVKESVAEKFMIHDRVFLVGDAAHIHSVNGGQGLNTGLADAFNLIWKLNAVVQGTEPRDLLQSYETERQAVAKSVIETSAELVRATKYSDSGTHALDYVNIVRKRAGNITGMGIRYGQEGELAGSRMYDFEINIGDRKTRLYSVLKYGLLTLILFSEQEIALDFPDSEGIIQISTRKSKDGYWTENSPYLNQAILLRPDSYIQSAVPLTANAIMRMKELGTKMWILSDVDQQSIQ